MPTYWTTHRNAFIQYVRAVNPNFERLLQSSLRPLIDELKREPTPRTPVWINNIKKWLLFAKRQTDGTYRNKARKYKDALYHLVQTLNIANDFTVSGTPKTNAYQYNQMAAPAAFDPRQAATANVTRLVPAGAYLNMTVEDYVARGSADGVFIIHMQGNDPAMDKKFDGWTTKEHMNSVLRVAKRCNPPLPAYALTMKADTPICLTEANPYLGLQTGHNPDSHSAWKVPTFRAWVAGKNNVVVMGFDGSICVDANLFGTNETIAHPHGVGVDVGGGTRFVAPLVSQTNVVTCRALLATSDLYPPNHVNQYGQLTGL